MRKALGVLAGGLAGFLSGLAVTLALVVGRAHFLRVYVESSIDVMGILSTPAVLGSILGVWVVLTGWLPSGRILAVTAGGALLGCGLGVLVGGVLPAGPEGPWAGGVIGTGAGVLLGAGTAFLLSRPWSAESGAPGRSPSGTVALAALCAPVLLGACSEPGSPEVGGGLQVPLPDTAQVARVVFLLGDPGMAEESRYPVLRRLRSQVEAWSGALDRDSAVSLVILGDVVYPEGLRPPGSSLRERDTTVVLDQVGVVTGPEARRTGVPAIFVAGNHDWGYRAGRRGADRIRSLEAFLDTARTRLEVPVGLHPAAGTGGPDVVDLGRDLRLILLDTAWWLLSREEERRAEVMAGVEEALRGAGGRPVVMAAHHPWRSAGPHAGFRGFRETWGIQPLLNRSGALLQDLNSRPYREMRIQLARVFRETEPPLLFAGGHEHSLQLLERRDSLAPRWSLVSGSASKLTGVSRVGGLVFARSAPGYAWLVVRRDGAVDLYVDATERPYLSCDDPGEEVAPCMEAGVAAYRTVFSIRLAER